MVSASTAASSEPAGLAGRSSGAEPRSSAAAGRLPGRCSRPVTRAGSTGLAGVLGASRLPRPKRRSGDGQRPSGENLLPALELLSRCPRPAPGRFSGALGRPSGCRGRAAVGPIQGAVQRLRHCSLPAFESSGPPGCDAPAAEAFLDGAVRLTLPREALQAARSGLRPGQGAEAPPCRCRCRGNSPTLWRVESPS